MIYPRGFPCLQNPCGRRPIHLGFLDFVGVGCLLVFCGTAGISIGLGLILISMPGKSSRSFLISSSICPPFYKKVARTVVYILAQMLFFVKFLVALIL